MLAFPLKDHHNTDMKHRHLVDGVGYTMAAIDDILDRGDVAAWADLYRAAQQDETIASKIESICRAHHMYGTSALWQRATQMLPRGVR